MNPRLLALKVLIQIIVDGKSLNQCGEQLNSKIEAPQDRSLARQLVYGVLRYYHQLDFLLGGLLQKQLKAKDADVNCLLLMGIYQLRYMRTPDHAAVNESVKLTQKLKKKWAKNLVNGVLRSYIRNVDDLEKRLNDSGVAYYAHPDWLLEKIKQDWSNDWKSIVEENNRHAPMILRVNQQKTSIDDYLKQLSHREISAQSMEGLKDAICLANPCDVNMLPGFNEGLVSVQDAAAQQAAGLLDIESNNYVLDACAAPGGKTAHMIETDPSIELLALDISQARTELIKNTLSRLGLKASIKSADILDVDSWWDGRYFDRILLDAPCSATGVIRRNPDIKIHRRLDDIEALIEVQRSMLDTLWPLLKPSGILLYATCSIIKDENENQVMQFIKSHDDAIEVKLNVSWGRQQTVGVQVLPGDQQMDGFYYARIDKRP